MHFLNFIMESEFLIEDVCLSHLVITLGRAENSFEHQFYFSMFIYYLIYHRHTHYTLFYKNQ